eukprot:SAG11_NODE_28452_length_321_cov_1.157658_1_plen_29_part_10
MKERGIALINASALSMGRELRLIELPKAF